MGISREHHRDIMGTSWEYPAFFWQPWLL